MKVHRWIAVLAAAALSLGVAACGGGDDDDDGGGGGGEVTEVPGFDGKTIKLGVLTPLTGPVAVIGNPLTAGNEVFIEAVNAEGGIAGQVPDRARPGGHAVPPERRGAEVQPDQGRRRVVRAAAGHAVDARGAAAARA